MGMVLKVFQDRKSLGDAAAAQAANAIRNAIKDHGTAGVVAATAASQVGEAWFADISLVPKQALSMSVKQLLKAKEILAVVPDTRKAQALKACFEGEISAMAPASILRRTGNATIYLDPNSAALLSSSLQI
jgi:6-phosphogluconolactonase/glucosamine-6-phosphate isomerase/deaminase